MVYDLLPTMQGPLLIAIDRLGLRYVEFMHGAKPVTIDPAWQRDAQALGPFTSQFRAYFAGELQQFDLPLAAEGTPFQRAVWHALQSIAYGQTVSYQTIAERIGNPKAMRAVGAANGKNPLSVIVPCHRVIGQNGALTGYAGGLAIKQWLLAHEASQRDFALQSATFN
ncbi:MAG: methylated-DNA--[protein]-cysteine S-methyltransferase [Aeromonas sp.]